MSNENQTKAAAGTSTPAAPSKSEKMSYVEKLYAKLQDTPGYKITKDEAFKALKEIEQSAELKEIYKKNLEQEKDVKRVIRKNSGRAVSVAKALSKPLLAMKREGLYGFFNLSKEATKVLRKIEKRHVLLYLYN